MHFKIISKLLMTMFENLLGICLCDLSSLINFVEIAYLCHFDE